MKQKVISLLLLVCMLSLVLAVPALATSASKAIALMDEADLLSQDEERELSTKLGQIGEEYNVQIVIITMDTMEGDDIDQFIELLYDSIGLGYGENKDGILLLVSMDPREVAILTNGSAHDAIGDREIEKILDAIVSDLSDGNYSDAFDTFADKCEYYLDGHVNGFPFSFGKTLLIAVVIGLLAGLITVFCLKAQLKSVRRQHQADAYVKPGSMQLRVRRDMFLYRNITRTRKQKSSSSGSSRSGSSRSVSSRSF